MKLLPVKFVSSLVVFATMLQFACCLQMAQAAVVPVTSAKSANSCCESEPSATQQSHRETPAEPCKHCPIMSGSQIGVSHIVQPANVAPDFSSPIMACVVEIAFRPVLTLARDFDRCVTATSPPPNLLVEHGLLQL